MVVSAIAVWDADFVRAYSQYERERQHAEQQEQFRSSSRSREGGNQPFARGFTPQDFEDLFRDPFSFFEREFARQQARQQQQQQGSSRGGGGYTGSSTNSGYGSARGGYSDSRSSPGGAAGVPPGDPLGYYRTLGVKSSATSQEIQAAFRGLALQHHPDRYSGDKEKAEATKKFQKVTEAYHVLRDKRKKQDYDNGMYRG
jgi:DnaJ-class molecular chaperone